MTSTHTPSAGSTTPTAASGAPRPPRTFSSPTTAQTVWLVAQREITVRLRSKAFVISTAILMLAVLASTVIGGLVSQNASLPSVAVVSSVAASVEGNEALDVTEAADAAAAEQLVRDGDVDAAIIPSTDASSPLGIEIVALEDVPTSVVSALSVAPPVQLLEAPSQNGFLVYLVGIGFGIVFFMSALTFGQTIAQSVVEEKQTRIVEILMSTVPVRLLLAGKVIGNSILAFGQILAIVVFAAIGLVVTGQNSLVDQLGPSLVWFVIFFVFGFVLVAALFAATAALVSRQEDVGSATSPITMLVMLPYVLIIVFSNNDLVLGIMSYVPFSATVAMPMRIFLGTAEWWEPLVSLVILIATTVAAILVGARIYSNSLLRTGSRVKLSEALRG